VAILARPSMRSAGEATIRARGLNVVHDLNVVQNLSRAHLTVVPDDRRERSRDKKRRAILAATDELSAEGGLAGVTMQGVADRLDCAVGTIYLYFESKAALIGALQRESVATLRASYETARLVWEDELAASDLDADLVALIGLCAFGAFWVSASVVFADEFHLPLSLLAEPGVLDAAGQDLEALATIRRLLDQPSGLIRAATDVDAIGAGDPSERAVLWLAALNGVLLLEHIAPVDRHLFRSHHLGRRLTHDLLCGWGAELGDVEVAAGHGERLAALGPMAPPPDVPGFD
jgi:AcrR family transcriptional regulator